MTSTIVSIRKPASVAHLTSNISDKAATADAATTSPVSVSDVAIEVIVGSDVTNPSCMLDCVEKARLDVCDDRNIIAECISSVSAGPNIRADPTFRAPDKGVDAPGIVALLDIVLNWALVPIRRTGNPSAEDIAAVVAAKLFGEHIEKLMVDDQLGREYWQPSEETLHHVIASNCLSATS
jgi:hypothetical protein